MLAGRRSGHSEGAACLRVCAVDAPREGNGVSSRSGSWSGGESSVLGSSYCCVSHPACVPRGSRRGSRLCAWAGSWRGRAPRGGENKGEAREAWGDETGRCQVEREEEVVFAGLRFESKKRAECLLSPLSKSRRHVQSWPARRPCCAHSQGEKSHRDHKRT